MVSRENLFSEANELWLDQNDLANMLEFAYSGADLNMSDRKKNAQVLSMLKLASKESRRIERDFSEFFEKI